MKKSREELTALIRRRIEAQFPQIAPQSDTELLTLLPDNQGEIKIILASRITCRAEDSWIRSSAALYMIEYFADSFFIKKILSDTIESFMAIRSPRMQSFIASVLRTMPGPLPPPQTETDRVENLLGRIAQIAYFAEGVIKKWAWDVEGKTLTCSIGRKKLF